MRMKLLGVFLSVGMSVAALSAAGPAEARRSARVDRGDKPDKGDERIAKRYADLLKSGEYIAHPDVISARTTLRGETRVLFKDGALGEIRGTVATGNKAEIRVLLPGKKATRLAALPKDPDLAEVARGYVAHMFKVEEGSVLPSELRWQPSGEVRNAPMVVR